MSDFDNGLTDSEVERLAILAEECGEVTQIVGKVLRHGYASHNPLASNPISNRGLLAKEIGDLRWIISLMLNEGDVAEGAVLQCEWIKDESAKPYLHHQNIQDRVRDSNI
jgi:NTP pyrophosphatase (non-canonical NTP hydrolase)